MRFYNSAGRRDDVGTYLITKSPAACATGDDLVKPAQREVRALQETAF